MKWQGGEVAAALMAGKRATLLVTCGGDAEDKSDLIQTMFEREIAYVRGVVAGKYIIIPNCTTPADSPSHTAKMADKSHVELIGG